MSKAKTLEIKIKKLINDGDDSLWTKDEASDYGQVCHWYARGNPFNIPELKKAWEEGWQEADDEMTGIRYAE